MPTLTLKFKDNVIKKYNFDSQKGLSIGRRENNDVVIANLTVSGNHAKIDYTDDGYLLTDLKSKNGSFVNNEDTGSAYLQDGDVIAIGKHNLIFTLDEGERLPDNIDNGMDQTMAMNTSSQRDLIKRANEHVPGEPRVGVLGFIEGGKGKIELTKKMMKIGKDPENDIIVHGFMVGKTAAILSTTPQGYSISHYGGFSKVKVNNQVIKYPVLLDEFDVIKIGSAELQFFYR